MSDVRMTIRPSRSAIGRVAGGVHFLVRVEPSSVPASGARRPVAFVLVIDRSGSMAGNKLAFVKAAALDVVDLTRDGDAIGVVAFDDEVEVLKPLTVVGPRTRPELRSAIDAIDTGGSTFLEGGLRAGLRQFGDEVRRRYGCKLVLLSDGEANVGERRAGVLAEVAAAAAAGGVTTSSLGVGFDYNIAMMTSVAEAGNGDFSHIHAPDDLREILRAELANAAEVTARAVVVGLELPERLAFGSNLNAYRQEITERGFAVLLGDLTRPKEFLFECTTPVPLEGDRLIVVAHATYEDVAGEPHRVEATATLVVCDEEEALRAPVDEEVLDRLLVQLPAFTEMEIMLAYEAGDLRRASRRLQASRLALDRIERRYRTSAAGPRMATCRDGLDRLEAGTRRRAIGSRELKTRYAASRQVSRSQTAAP